MEIILLQDVKNLGYKDDIVSVKPGFGRNFLLPKGQAIIANETNKKINAETKRQRSFKEDKLRSVATSLAESLTASSVVIAAKVGESGKIFGSINNIQLAEALKKQGIDIDRKSIELIDAESIKTVGSYKAIAKLYKDIKAEINFEVVKEEA